jgi:Cdc6-like AAA superfamily ATPase
MNKGSTADDFPTTEDGWFHLQLDIERLFSGGPIDEEDLFAGRLTEVRRMLEAVFDKSKHIILFGERGVGKTSIANVFWKRYNASLQTFVAARVQADPSDSFSSLCNKAIEELAFVARSMGKYDLVPVDDTIDINSVDAMRRELRKCRPNGIPIIIFDEFDKIRDEETRELFANLIKSLHDYAVNTTLIIVGVAEDVAGLIEDHMSIPRAIVQIPLDRMSDSELNEVIDTRLNNTVMKIEGDARWTIIRLSKGLPYFTQTLCKHAAIISIEKKEGTISYASVRQAINRFIDESEQTFIEAYETAISSPQGDALFKQVLLACARCEPDSRGFFTPTDVITPFSQIMGARKTHAHFASHLNKFISDDRGAILIRKGHPRSYRFRFADPMMQPYVILRGIKDGMLGKDAEDAILQREEPLLPIDF